MQTIIKKAFATARTRLLLLDYDGTLREFETDPLTASPTPEIEILLRKLSAVTGTTVVLISGRARETMEAWFGLLPVNLVAEHGFFRREAGHGWEAASRLADSWKPAVRALFEVYTARVPASCVEEKSSALAWHYRACDQTTGRTAALQLQSALQAVAIDQPLEIIPGHCVVEVHEPGINKGIAARQWLAAAPWDFILAAGDDRTDQDIFNVLPPDAFSIHVGPGIYAQTTTLRVDTPQNMRQLLRSFL